MIKQYFSAVLVARSPLKIGSGLSEHTESDVLLDNSGAPYIPGTALAGVTRHYLADYSKTTAAANVDVDYWYGKTVPGKDEGQEGHIVFYDAPLTSDGGEQVQAWAIRQRDGVGLDDFKVVDGTAKFDYEVVEKGSTFRFRFELECDEGNKEDALALADYLLDGFENEDIAVGSKTMRGFGQFGVEKDSCRLLALDLFQDIDRYIDFNWDQVCPVKNTHVIKHRIIDGQRAYTVKRYVFTVEQFLIIRDYATEEKDERGTFIDAEQLKDSNKNPIIPGTSWAGFFRHHMKKILRRAGYANPDAELKRLFGDVDTSGGRGNRVKSSIGFNESSLNKDSTKQLNRTRTAIDRFTAGAAEGLLFTTQASFGGGGLLVIRLRRDLPNRAFIESLLDAVIDDINEGLAAIGGMTAVGYGLLKVAPGEVKQLGNHQEDDHYEQ
jgi:CRISPR/Cas system CSM-associated protein Csm3 (group 7 of RAMP superfamily)